MYQVSSVFKLSLPRALLNIRKHGESWRSGNISTLFTLRIHTFHYLFVFFFLPIRAWLYLLLEFSKSLTMVFCVLMPCRFVGRYQLFGETYCLQVGFEVFTAVSMKMAVFWVVAPCSLVELYQRFREKTAIFMLSPSTRHSAEIYRHTNLVAKPVQPHCFVFAITRTCPSFYCT
jgi:hypothetical protein